MKLSVVVTSHESPGALRRCLESLTRQLLIEEIVVADCSEADPALALAPVFTAVRFLHFDRVRTVPQLRWTAVKETRGDVVAAVEARCVPGAEWSGALLAAHERHPEAPAIGGPVAVALPASALDLGLYFSEYGLFAPPAADAEVKKLSGANLSWKRAALEASRDLLDAGAWETLLHERWRAEGKPLRMCPAEVTFHNTMRGGTALRQRFHYGRGYAADRVEGAPAGWRILYAAAAPVLPFLLTARAARKARPPLRSLFWRSLPWLLLLNTSWSLGELTGYLAGKSGKTLNF